MAKASWFLGLVKTFSDPANHIISGDSGVVLKDKYPKSKHHYLVPPKDDIPSIYDLKPVHLELLSELHLLAVNVIEVMNGEKEDFKIGFHAQPSMERLHVHVISKDFVSPCLKTKKHWNSFNTNLFRSYEDVVSELERLGHVKKFDDDVLKELRQTELQCNQCKYKPKTMPDLKEHLLLHFNKKK